MPIYEYTCRECQHTFDRFMKIDNRKIPESEPCPNCKKEGSVYQGVSAVPMGDPVRLGITRPDNGFHDVLRRIHERNPGSNIKDTSTLTRL